MLLGLTWMAIPFLLYPIAEQTVNTSITGMINGGLPIVTAVVTAAFTQSRAQRPFRIGAVLIGGAGIAVISLASVGDDAGADTTGIVLLLVALSATPFAANVARPMHVKYGALADDVVDRDLGGDPGRCPYGVYGFASAPSRGRRSARCSRSAPWAPASPSRSTACCSTAPGRCAA